MRHNFEMKIQILAPLAAITAACALSGCTVNIEIPASMGDETMMGSPLENSIDEVSMFAQMMIPHHQQAIDMANLALSKESSSPEVKDLSERIIAGQTPEIFFMEGWLEESAAPTRMMGMMSAEREAMMGGMATAEEMANLKTLDGLAFDREFLSLMIVHHEGALRMVHMIQNSSFEEAAQLAEDIVRLQTSEISEMRSLLEDGSSA